MTRHNNQRTADFTAWRPKREHRQLSSEEVAAQTAAFLESGGAIEEVPRGATGHKEGQRPLIINVKTNRNCV